MGKTYIGAVRFAGNKKLYYFTTKDDSYVNGNLVAVMLKNGSLEKASFVKYVSQTGQLPPCRIIGLL